jgi:hypothetical protein
MIVHTIYRAYEAMRRDEATARRAQQDDAQQASDAGRRELERLRVEYEELTQGVAG